MTDSREKQVPPTSKACGENGPWREALADPPELKLPLLWQGEAGERYQDLPRDCPPGALFTNDASTKEGGSSEPCRPEGIVIRFRPCRTALNVSAICDYTLNCYGGCAHGCVYCYARFIQRFYPRTEPWGQFVDVKLGVLEALRRQLRRLRPGRVFMSSACDGWQPVEAVYRLSRKSAELLLAYGFSISILTKSQLILQDLDSFADRPVTVGISLSTLDQELAHLWEPRAAPPAKRLEVLRAARACGLKTTLMIAPILPALSDNRQELRRMMEVGLEAGAEEICVDAFNRRPKVWESVCRLLEAHFPGLVGWYRRLLFDETTRARYLTQLRQRVVQVAQSLGVRRSVDICF
ncbi:MAG: radical SAM protein [Thermoguttaceae bacterium]|nr:radical SAM protein [Thermoguttaceae bacterium]